MNAVLLIFGFPIGREAAKEPHAFDRSPLCDASVLDATSVRAKLTGQLPTRTACGSCPSGTFSMGRFPFKVLHQPEPYYIYDDVPRLFAGWVALVRIFKDPQSESTRADTWAWYLQSRILRRLTLRLQKILLGRPSQLLETSLETGYLKDTSSRTYVLPPMAVRPKQFGPSGLGGLRPHGGAA